MFVMSLLVPFFRSDTDFADSILWVIYTVDVLLSLNMFVNTFVSLSPFENYITVSIDAFSVMRFNVGSIFFIAIKI